MSRQSELAELSRVYDSSALSNRNLFINGAMQVAQRGSVAALQTGYGACDRFRLASNSAARFDTSQSTDVPSSQGFSNSLKLDCSTADTSVAAGDYYQLQHMIEGQNLQHLLHGSSSAKQCTLSFWVKSPKTGIHNLEIQHVDGGVYNIYQYTIASANTWQNVSFTFDGYQTTAIANDNTTGLVIVWWLIGGTTFSGGSYTQNSWTSSNANRAVGQVNVADSTSNDFYLTGVQMEVGTEATPFEHRSVGDEIERCQRYYLTSYSAGQTPGVSTSNVNSQLVTGWTDGNCPFPPFSTTMRAAPSVTLRPRSSNTTGQINNGGTDRNATATEIGTKGVSYIAVTSGTGGQYNGFSYECDAEL